MPAVVIGNEHNFVHLDRSSKTDLDDLSFVHGYPLSVSVQCEGFAGANGEIWFELEELETFLAGLKKLEATRQGSISLATKIPPPSNEVVLTVYSQDRAGHIAVQVDLQKYAYVGNETKVFRVSVAFEIDNLPTLVDDMTHFLTLLKQ